MTTSDILSTSQIESLVESYRLSEANKSVDPLTTKKTKYSNIVSQYGTLSSKVSALKNLTDLLKNQASDSVLNSKAAAVPTNNYFTATATTSLQNNSFNLRVNQLAKSDTILSKVLNSSDTASITGNHDMLIKVGDGSGGEYTTHISVSLTDTETSQTVIDKVKTAIQNDTCNVISTGKNENDPYSGGDSSFKVNISGTDHVVNISGASTYKDVFDQITQQLNGITGLSVTKSTDGNGTHLTFGLSDKTKYLTIENTSGFDIVSDLSINANKEKAASDILSVSSFKPEELKSRLSILSSKSGLDCRIKEISDINGGNALSFLGLNFGTTRTQFDQTTAPDVSGFLYADTTITNNRLNSKFELNGLAMQRNSNQVSNVVDGLTLSFTGVMKADDNAIDFTTGSDTKAIRSQIDTFITKYNDLFSFTKSNSDLVNDANIRTINQVLSQSSFSLYKVGISFSPGTGFSVTDSDLLNKVITSNPGQIQDLFSSDSGIATNISKKLAPYLGNSGIISRGLSSYNNNISWLTDKITANQSRIDKSADTLRKRYQQLQVQVASLLSSQGYF